MWLVVTVGSPCALNIASAQSRMRWRVSRAIVGGRVSPPVSSPGRRTSASRRPGRCRELGPGFVLGGGGEVEKARLRAADGAFRALFVQGGKAPEGGRKGGG